MSQSIPQLSFTAGELAPEMYSRSDINRYYSGAREILNFVVRPYGGLSNRTGTTYVGDLGGSSRLIPFQFSTVQTYVLAFGDYTLRVFTNGGQVVYPVGHASAGQPVVIATIYPEAALQRLKFTQNADVMTLCHPDYPPQQLSRYDHHDWRFAAFSNTGGPFLDVNVDDTITMYSSGVTGNITVTSTVPFFTSDMVGRLLYLGQSPDSTVQRWEVQKGITVNDIRRAGSNYYKAVAGGTTGTVRPDHTEGTSYDGDPGVPWLYLHSGSGVVLITSIVSSTVVNATVVNRLPDKVMASTVPKNITGLTPGDGISVPVRVTIPAHGFFNASSVTVQGVVGTTAANGTWQILVIDANTFDLVGCFDNQAYISGGSVTYTFAAIPTYKWALEAWGGDQNYPGATTYYQQRQAFAASLGKPQALWFSRTKGYTDFGTSTPVLDDDSISFTVASREVQEIRHIVELSDLILFTSGGSWTMKGTSDGVLTPSSVNVKRQGAIGCSHVAPVIIGSNALFITEKGSQLRSLGYSFQQDAFIGNDLTVISHHLFSDHSMVDMAFQNLPYSCLWVVREDGMLLGLTYLPDQDVAGWHHHTTIGQFRAVCCVSEGGEDAVYFAVDRMVSGTTKHYLERVSARSAGIFLDSALTYSGAPVSSVSGLSHLEGLTVGILADGEYAGTAVVSGGSINLPAPASAVVVGLPIISQLETLDITSSQGNLRTAQKLVNHVSLLVDESEEVLAGPDAANLMVYTRDSSMVGADSSLASISIPATWSKTARIVVRQEKPLPLSVLAVIPEVSTGGV